MKIFARGNTIPHHLKTWTSNAGDLKYWLLLPCGAPDPDAKPYRRRWEIELTEPRDTYEVRSNPVGKPATGFSQRDYDRARAATDQGRADAAERKRRSRARKQSTPPTPPT